MIGVYCNTCDKALETETDLEGIRVTLCRGCWELKEKNHKTALEEKEEEVNMLRQEEIDDLQEKLDEVMKKIIGIEGISAVYDNDYEAPLNMVVTTPQS